MLIDDPQAGAVEFNGDGLASVSEANLDALARDLDAAAAGYPPLDCQAGLWQRSGPARRTPWRRCRWPGGMGQGTVRHRMPSWVMTCMTWPPRRIRARCPASGEPTWMTWLPRMMIPAALTSRWTSTQLVAAKAPGALPAGGGPACRAPFWRSRARSTADSRERWIRQQRSDVYVEMLAIYGRMARKATYQEEEYKLLTPEERRLSRRELRRSQVTGFTPFVIGILALGTA
jgi:hypothetical protein